MWSYYRSVFWEKSYKLHNDLPIQNKRMTKVRNIMTSSSVDQSSLINFEFFEFFGIKFLPVFVDFQCQIKLWLSLTYLTILTSQHNWNWEKFKLLAHDRNLLIKFWNFCFAELHLCPFPIIFTNKFSPKCQTAQLLLFRYFDRFMITAHSRMRKKIEMLRIFPKKTYWAWFIFSFIFLS